MGGAWETPSPEQTAARMVTSVLEVIASGYTTAVSGANTGEVRHITRIGAHSEIDTAAHVLYITRVDASGTARVQKTFRFNGGLSGTSNFPEFNWQGKNDYEPVLTLHALEYLQVRASVSGASSVTAEFYDATGQGYAQGGVEDLR